MINEIFLDNKAKIIKRGNVVKRLFSSTGEFVGVSLNKVKCVFTVSWFLSSRRVTTKKQGIIYYSLRGSSNSKMETLMKQILMKLLEKEE